MEVSTGNDMSYQRYPTALVILGFLTVAAEYGFAQPQIQALESIESIVMNADRVWIAKIVEVADDPIPGGSDKPRIAIEIEETLKYPLFETRLEKTILFVEHPTTVFHDFQERSCRLLIAHNDRNRRSMTMIELASEEMEVFRADLTLLRDSDAVVQVAKDRIAKLPANVRQFHTVEIMLPKEKLQGTSFGHYARLNVPVDEALEKLAIEFLESDDYMKRWQAAQFLRYFKSPDNIDRLVQKLDDSGCNETGKNGQHQWYYGVRDEAYKTLDAWGVEVKRPVVIESNHDRSK